MKKILITGSNSYVGTNVEKWLMKQPEKYYIETLDMKNPEWKHFDFSKFDVVFHVAGIAHVNSNNKMDDLYFKVNRDLAIETAKKSKNSQIKHFIFMSSMIIYGEDNSIYNKENINIDLYNPVNSYGKSKLQADLGIQNISGEGFNVSIIRTPLIYGPKCKGNFLKLQRFAKNLMFVPEIKNQRSMIYIENFSEFVKKIIDDKEYGIFYPQNNKYVNTTDIIKVTRKTLGKKTISFKLLNPLIRLLTKKTQLFKKIYGNKTYDLELNMDKKLKYNLVDFEESIKRSIS